MGSKFRVVVADLEMLKEIMVKQHDSLPYRGIISVSLVCILLELNQHAIPCPSGVL